MDASNAAGQKDTGRYSYDDIEPAVDRHQNTLERIPGAKDFWFLIAADCSLFSFFFITYMFYRHGSVELYVTSQQTLNRGLGALNTAVLIIGSWGVVQALKATRLDQPRLASHYLAFSTGCGLTFLCVKFFEYWGKFSHGLYPTTNDFFMFYFALTMIHTMHIIVGIVVLTVLRRGVKSGKYYSGNMVVLESGAVYWHMIDLLWIFIFSLLYLLK
jgi:nitric oxide reductase NorE protein